jgi:hypothetical protein
MNTSIRMLQTCPRPLEAIGYSAERPTSIGYACVTSHIGRQRAQRFVEVL